MIASAHQGKITTDYAKSIIGTTDMSDEQIATLVADLYAIAHAVIAAIRNERKEVPR